MNDNKSSNNDFLAINLMETKETEKKKREFHQKRKCHRPNFNGQL